MHRDVAIEPNGARGRINFDAAEIENEAVAQRTVDLVGFGRRRQLRRRPEYGFADCLIEFGGDCARRPMAGRGQACKRHGVVNIAAGGDTAIGKHDLSRWHVELRCRQAGEAIAQFEGGEPRGARYRRREPA